MNDAIRKVPELNHIDLIKTLLLTPIMCGPNQKFLILKMSVLPFTINSMLLPVVYFILLHITNEVIPTTNHRVVNPDHSVKERYSMPFFCHPHANAELTRRYIS